MSEETTGGSLGKFTHSIEFKTEIGGVTNTLNGTWIPVTLRFQKFTGTSKEEDGNVDQKYNIIVNVTVFIGY